MQERTRGSGGREPDYPLHLSRLLLPLLLLWALPAAAQAGPFLVEADSTRVVYWEGDRGVAERTLAAALAPLPLPGIPQTFSASRSTIFLPPTAELFDSLTFGSTPAWAAGVAIPSQRKIILPAYRRDGPLGDPVITLRHEIAHLALNDYLGSNVPRWFDEGYATWVSGGWDAGSGWQIRLALLAGNLPPLDSLTLGWPRGEARARLSYLLSASAVVHLATSRGDRAFTAFLRRWRNEGTLDTAMRETYLLTLPQFEREWRQMVRTRYGWLLAVSQLTVFWLALAILVFVLGILRRKRNRERLEELRREEYMLPPGDPPEVDRDWYQG